MYSPKISETLIPLLYHLGKARHMPMTRLVDTLIRRALAAEEQPQEGSGLPESIFNSGVEGNEDEGEDKAVGGG